MPGIYDIEICDFEFYPHDPNPNEKKQQDPRVSATVVELLGGYFENERRVLIYLCDSSDGRPKQRQALFTKWHKNIGDAIKHTPVEISVRDVVVYGGLLTRKDFPHPDVLQYQLVDKAAGFILEKFER